MQLLAAGPSSVRALHIGGYWRGPNDMVRQMMLGLRAAGVQVTEYNTDEHPEALETDGRPYNRGSTGPVWLHGEALAPEIGRTSPDLIVCNAGGLSFRPEEAARLRRTACLLGIALSDPDVFEPTTRHIAGNFDLFLTNAPACVAQYQALGARCRVLPIATNEEFFHPVPPQSGEACEVLVMGRAHADRVEPVRALMENFDTHLFGEGWDAYGLPSRGLIFGRDVLTALSSCKIAVVFFLTAGGHPLVKVGLLDFPAAGALVATNRYPEVERYLAFDREIIGFDSLSDMLEKIRYALDHPEEAEVIRRAGRERVLREHTWKAVWPRILGWAAQGGP